MAEKQLSVSGTLTVVGKPESKESKSGKKFETRDFVINVGGTYPHDIAFIDFSDKCKLANVPLNSWVEVLFDVSSREYKGKYYTQLTAFRVEKKEVAGFNEPAKPTQAETKPEVKIEAGTQVFDESDNGDGLPF